MLHRPGITSGLAAIVTIAAVVALAALAWLPGAPKHETPLSARIPATGSPPAPEGLPPPVEPSVSENDLLSVAELRWCLTEAVRLETIQPRLATRPAADRYNDLAADFNHRCGGRSSSNEVRDEVAPDVAASRESIVAAAIEDVQRLNDAVPLSTDRAQELLSTLGYEPGVVNGVYGAQTKEAISAFQRRNGIPADGLLSRELFDQLARALGRQRILMERCRIRSLRDANGQQGTGFRC